MPKEWILNQANMRWQLNRPKHVGHVAAEIRKCSPKSLEDWEKYYLEHVRSKEQLEAVGKTLYEKVTGICKQEIDQLTEKDCVDYVFELVFDRTYDGYQSEIKAVYGELQKILGVEISFAPDEWDRGYNVDFFIKIRGKYIGLQIKPAGYEYIPQIINEYEFQKETHRRFTEKYGGKVFYVISVKTDKGKEIYNKEVIQEISDEIKRLWQG
jgi:hypothetical protein